MKKKPRPTDKQRPKNPEPTVCDGCDESIPAGDIVFICESCANQMGACCFGDVCAVCAADTGN